MMMDIYEDLDNFDMGETISELKKENDKLTEKVDELIKKLETTVEDLEKVKKENLILSQNISKLFNTAKADYDRRTRIIADLTKQIDDLVFKRNQAGQNYRIPKRKAEPEPDLKDLPESKRRKFEPVQQKENKASELKEKPQNENKNKHIEKKESNNTKTESRKPDNSHKNQNRKETTDKRRSRSLSRERKRDHHGTSRDKDRNRRSPDLRSKIDRKSKPENLDYSFALEQKKVLEMINKKKSRQNDIESISIHSSSSSEGLINDKRSIEHKTTSKSDRKKKDDTKATVKREERGKEIQRGQGTEDGGKRTEDRGKRTEDRGKRTEDRGKRTRKGETRKEPDVNKKNEKDGKKKDDKEVTEKEKTNHRDQEKDKSIKENVKTTTTRPEKKIERTRNLDDLEEGEITDDENELSLIQHEINVTSKERSLVHDRATESRRPSITRSLNTKPDKLDPDLNDTTEKNKERCPKSKQEDLKKPDADVSNKNLDNETKNVPEAKHPETSEIKVTIAKIDINTEALVKANNIVISDRLQSNSTENIVLQDKPVSSESVMKTEIIVKSIETEKSIKSDGLDSSSTCISVNKEATDNVSVNPVSTIGEDIKSEDKENTANQNICQMTTPAIRPKPKRPRCRILNS